jgi:hypothetical protein
LKEKAKKTLHFISVRIISVQYNNGRTLLLPGNSQRVEWTLKEDGSQKELKQRFEVGTERDERELTATFNVKTNETVIREEPESGPKIIRPGLVLLQMSTNEGQLVSTF